MNSLRLFDRRVGFVIIAAALLLAGIIPSIVSAAQLTERSIALSSSSINATDVAYKVKFTAAGGAGAVVLDFCEESPVVGQECTEPADFSLADAETVSAGFSDLTVLDDNTLVVTKTITAAEAITLDITGVTNPSTVGPLYARILTYNNPTNAAAYTSEVLGSGKVDDGGAAISITNTIGVSAAVLETVTFCVSGAAIDADCANVVTAPVLKLGETTGDVVALTADEVSTGNIYTQISTNALNGVVISLKSSALNCGGLVRAGAPTSCDIEPALDDGITEGQAKFGVKTAAATNSVGADNPNGTLQAVPLSNYNNSTFALNYTIGNATGVTSTFGDPFLNTNGAPANNKNMVLTFGASISNSTPAGLYSVDLGLIATGRF